MDVKGDTIRGFINYKEWDYDPSRIEFKKIINSSNKSEYSMDNVSAFTITGFEMYRRFTMPVSQDQTQFSSLRAGIDTGTINKTAFFKVVAAGKNITLYSYIDKIRQRFFVAECLLPPVELRYHIYLDPNEQGKILTDNGYKKQFVNLVTKYVPGQAELYTEIQQADYNYTDLAKLVNKINGVSELTAEQHVLAKPGTSVFITAGLNNSIVKISGADYLNNVPSSSSLFPQIGAGINLYLNKNIGRLVFRYEMYLGKKIVLVSSSRRP